MTDISCHSYRSNNSLQDIFDSSLHRFLDEPGHLSALEMVLNDSTYLKDHLEKSNGSLPCHTTTLLEVSASSFDPETSQELMKSTETNLVEDMEEIMKLREMKLQLERDLKAKKERKKRRAQRKKRMATANEMNEEESTPGQDLDVIDQEKLPKKMNEDDGLKREKTKRHRDQKTSPQMSKKELRRETCTKQSPEQSHPKESHTKCKKDESLKLRELYTDSGSLLLEGYIQVEGNRRRHSSHERTLPFEELTNSDVMEINNDKEPVVNESKQFSPTQERRRHSSCDLSRKVPGRCTSCPIQEITIVRTSKRNPSDFDVTHAREETKLKSKEDEGNKDIKDKNKAKQTKQAKKEKINQERIPKAVKTKEDSLTEAQLNALKEWRALAAAAKLKEERLKTFEKERGSSASPRIRSKKKPGLSNKPPPKCIMDALNWATRNGLFGVNHDQTRRARIIAAHRREKFEELVGEYDKGVILRRHSVSS